MWDKGINVPGKDLGRSWELGGCEGMASNLTIGLDAFVPLNHAVLVQFVCSGSLASSGTAMHRFVPPGQPAVLGSQRPGYTWTTLPLTMVAEPV